MSAITQLISLALNLSGIGPTLDVVRIVAKFTLVAAVLVVVATTLGVDVMAITENLLRSLLPTNPWG